MRIVREERTAVILKLVLNSITEKVGWRLFAERLEQHLMETYGASLPAHFGSDAFGRETDAVAKTLIETVGEERAVLSAYRVAENLMNVQSSEAAESESGASARSAVAEQPRGDNSDTEGPEKDESKPLTICDAGVQTTKTMPGIDVESNSGISQGGNGGENGDSDQKSSSPTESPISPSPAIKPQTSSEEGEEEKSAEERVSEPRSEDSDDSDKSFYTASTVLEISSDLSTPSSVTEEEKLDRIERGGEPDGNPDGGGEEADSDADSGYYSADGGRAGTPSSPRPDIDSDPEETQEGPGDGGADRGPGSHGGGGDADENDASSESGDELTAASTPVDPVCALRKCFERQAMMLTGAFKDALDTASRRDTPLTVDSVQFQLERFVFNPDPRVPPEHREVRYNFYPPFMPPKAIANYHIFAVTAPIPASCKANRSGTELLASCRETNEFKRLPRWRVGVQVDDGLGEEVVPVTELTEDVKLVPLQDDVSRLQWAKMRGEHIRFFSYPSLHMPPKISRMLMETLLQPFADENDDKAEEPAPCVSDEELRYIVDPSGRMQGEELEKAMQRRRAMVTMAVRYTAQLELMERVFREPSLVKKIQEVLHHTFHHGFVALVRETAKVNLSNYATYHGITYNNPLNNCIVAKLLEGADKEDYVLDSIYLFLVFTWQTAMGMWQQAIDETTLQMYAEVFTKQRRAIYALTTVTDMCKAIVDILMDGDRLTEEMRKALPNFITQSQISDFRHFLMERSNVPTVAAPFYPSDFVPLAFRQSAPLLWDQVYLLQMAFFLTNHGGYLWEPPEEEQLAPSYRTYCPCNLCSPHRMPADNVALHNEVLAIGTFEIRSADGKTFKLTPELWANAYLDKFVPDDFHPFTVFHYPENSSSFTRNHTACVTESPEILTLIRQIQASREEFLLKKGKGVYKDPQTGETLTSSAASVGPEARPGAVRGGASLPSAAAGACGGARAPPKPARAVRAASASSSAEPVATSEACDYGDLARQIVDYQFHQRLICRYGSEDARREDQSNRRAAVGRDRRSLPYGSPGFVRGGGGHGKVDRVRRRNFRKPGYGGGGPSEYHLGGGGRGDGGSGEGECTSVEGASRAAPLRILSREDSAETSCQERDPAKTRV
ncbi:100K [Aviadenovirus cerasi]|uniref:Shutoff protein n=1 Tax=Fowl aviadenovirus 5 TaxID=172861 RepID=A0A6M3Z4Z1_9ADEN|nr:100K [Fowl aviadenovirus 5]